MPDALVALGIGASWGAVVVVWIAGVVHNSLRASRQRGMPLPPRQAFGTLCSVAAQATKVDLLTPEPARMSVSRPAGPT
jgi:hypothetical protein